MPSEPKYSLGETVMIKNGEAWHLVSIMTAVWRNKDIGWCYGLSGLGGDYPENYILPVVKE